jgi:hypothetical protein
LRVVFLIGGVGVYLLAWLYGWPVGDQARQVELRSFPRRLRPVVQRGSGKVLLIAVMLEATAVLMVVVGVASSLAWPERLVTFGYNLVAAAWVIDLGAWSTLEIRARQRRRPDV